MQTNATGHCTCSALFQVIEALKAALLAHTGIQLSPKLFDAAEKRKKEMQCLAMNEGRGRGERGDDSYLLANKLTYGLRLRSCCSRSDLFMISSVMSLFI